MEPRKTPSEPTSHLLLFLLPLQSPIWNVQRDMEEIFPSLPLASGEDLSTSDYNNHILIIKIFRVNLIVMIV